jgi:hypothetical protein
VDGKPRIPGQATSVSILSLTLVLLLLLLLLLLLSLSAIHITHDFTDQSKAQ